LIMYGIYTRVLSIGRRVVALNDVNTS